MTSQEPRPPFAAADATRAERDRIAALAPVVQSLVPETLPAELADLSEDLYRLLTADDRHFWDLIEPERRVPMLQRAQNRALLNAERNAQRALRQDTCAHYIDLLCLLVHTSRREVGEQAYGELRERYLQAKSDWEAMRRAPKPKNIAGRTWANVDPEVLEDAVPADTDETDVPGSVKL
jgi:hypothetical protein